ncbi:hypothetical protein P3L10_012434 [Capsicum annuum]
MINLLSWNVRGLNAPNKQKEVQLLCNEENMCLIGLLETKIKREKIDSLAVNMFACWSYVTNLEEHYNGRICLTWRPDYYRVSTISKNAQQITCEDRIGGAPVVWFEVADFTDCVHECGL